MYRYLFIGIVVLLGACDTSNRNNEEGEDMDTLRQEQNTQAYNQNVQVEFSCDSLTETGKYAVSILVENLNESVPVDTVDNCKSLNVGQYQAFGAPDYINGLAEAGNYIYYSYVDSNQLVVMRSPKGSDSMNYETHLQVPLQPVINEPQTNQ